MPLPATLHDLLNAPGFDSFKSDRLSNQLFIDDPDRAERIHAAAENGAVAPQFAMTRQWKEGRTNHTSQCQDAIDARLPVNAEAFERYTKAPTDPDWRLKNTAGYIRTGTSYHYTETPTT